MTDEDLVLACPHCDTAGQIYERIGADQLFVGDPDHKYACAECSQSFEEPNERPRKDHSGGSTPGKNAGVSDELLERVRRQTDLDTPETG